MPGHPVISVDARGLRCPWPALRLARAMREGAAAVELIADDPAAAGEIAALCRERDWTLVAEPPRFVVRRRAGPAS